MLPSVEGVMVDDHTVSCQVILFSSCGNLPYHPSLKAVCLYCVELLFCLSLSRVPYVASFSEFSILDFPIRIL